MNAVTKSRPGHWAAQDFRDAGFHDIEPADPRVSHAEQQDHQVPVGEPAIWHVVGLCLSPFIVIIATSAIARFLFNR